MHIHNLSRLVILSEGHILLTKTLKSDGSPFFFLPGGHIEYHETLHETALRELEEELGILPHHVKDITPIGVYEYAWDNKGAPYHEIAFISRCEVEGLRADTPVPSQEAHITFEWVPLQHLAEVAFLPAHLCDILPKWATNPIRPEAFFSSAFLTR